MLKDVLDPTWRKRVYVAFGAASVLVGAVQIAFATAGAAAPLALSIALSVLPYLGAAFGFTAAANTRKADTAK